MAPNEASTVSVSRRGSEDAGGDPLRVVVWVRGEHDVATRTHLAAVLDRAAGLDDADVVVDLSGITFMDASTIGAVVEAHNHLRARSRSLCVRAPSPIARRLLDVCQLGFLIDGHPTRRASVAALDSWVAVPPSDPAPQPVEAPALPEEPALPTALRSGGATTSIPAQRTPS